MSKPSLQRSLQVLSGKTRERAAQQPCTTPAELLCTIFPRAEGLGQSSPEILERLDVRVGSQQRNWGKVTAPGGVLGQTLQTAFTSRAPSPALPGRARVSPQAFSPWEPGECWCSDETPPRGSPGCRCLHRRQGAAPHQFSLRERWHRARPPFTAAFSFALIHCVSFLAACEEQRESLFQQTGPIRSTRLLLERGLEKRDGGEGVSPTPPGPRVPPARRFPANTGARTLPQPLEDQRFVTRRRKPGASNTEIISWIVPDVTEEAGKPQAGGHTPTQRTRNHTQICSLAVKQGAAALRRALRSTQINTVPVLELAAPADRE
ncbi:uncharacterized protein LOC135409599 [Pseudopipra pipra]|uniref:uncharacterized protein LOC135409599 n=1 Tax=Pseudopipra pipra TaxID=415032 RepID=UPI0031386D2B